MILIKPPHSSKVLRSAEVWSLIIRGDGNDRVWFCYVNVISNTFCLRGQRTPHYILFHLMSKWPRYVSNVAWHPPLLPLNTSRKLLHKLYPWFVWGQKRGKVCPLCSLRINPLWTLFVRYECFRQILSLSQNNRSDLDSNCGSTYLPCTHWQVTPHLWVMAIALCKLYPASCLTGLWVYWMSHILCVLTE